jgi:putative ABC transport system substrate-binding protein
VAVAVNTSSDVPDATLALLAQNIDAICQVGGNLTSSGFASIVQPARRARVPVFGFLTADSQGGAVVAAARDYYEGGRDAGQMAARVMRGASPATIPFQPLVKTRILVRRDAARAVGLTIPPAVLEKAAEVTGE